MDSEELGLPESEEELAHPEEDALQTSDDFRQKIEHITRISPEQVQKIGTQERVIGELALIMRSAYDATGEEREAEMNALQELLVSREDLRNIAPAAQVQSQRMAADKRARESAEKASTTPELDALERSVLSLDEETLCKMTSLLHIDEDGSLDKDHLIKWLNADKLARLSFDATHSYEDITQSYEGREDELKARVTEMADTIEQSAHSNPQLRESLERSRRVMNIADHTKDLFLSQSLSGRVGPAYTESAFRSVRTDGQELIQDFFKKCADASTKEEMILHARDLPDVSWPPSVSGAIGSFARVINDENNTVDDIKEGFRHAPDQLLHANYIRSEIEVKDVREAIGYMDVLSPFVSEDERRERFKRNPEYPEYVQRAKKEMDL